MAKIIEPEELIENYIYPLFRVQNKEDLIYYMSYGTVIYGICTFLTPLNIPYGKHSAKWAGFGVPPKLAWFVQELPSFLIPVVLAIYGRNNGPLQNISNQVFLGMFVLHYFQRTFIYVALMKSGQPTPFLPFAAAVLTTSYNGILHGLYFVSYYSYNDQEWLARPNFWIGVLLFFIGMGINVHSDSILRNLRTGKSKEYKIPTGGMFEYVSCANYFGEILEMFGYAVASLSPPAMSFSIFVFLFLSTKGRQNHQWYLKKFEGYPSNRKSVIPLIF